ncbi:MAG TPA: DUF5069 domain-containing protein [Candidatus Baltobacteraceae bacterium]|nr:DUF5069 domain-containing protein [Candidatus Baltobacteraceae bacterium]
MSTAPAPDLAKQAPRSPFEDLDGIKLLPRAIDKARAHLAGTLGEYIYCGCKLNAQLFETLGVTEDDFLEAVRTSPTDEDVVSWVHERVRPDPARVAEMNNRVTHDSAIEQIDKEEGRH